MKPNQNSNLSQSLHRPLWALWQEKFNKELQGALFDDSDSLFNTLFQSQLAKTDLYSAVLDALA